jgi:hypothetical protein
MIPFLRCAINAIVVFSCFLHPPQLSLDSGYTHRNSMRIMAAAQPACIASKNNVGECNMPTPNQHSNRFQGESSASSNLPDNVGGVYIW